MMTRSLSAPHHNNNTSKSLRPPKSRFFSTPDPTSLLDLDLDLDLESPPLSPRCLYAEAIDETLNARSTPSANPGLRQFANPERRHRKSTRDMIGNDDFDALPIAVRRKYFSTLERLRFAENPTAFTINDLAAVPTLRRYSSTDRRAIRTPLRSSASASPTGKLQRRSRRSSVSSADVSWFLTLPDKIRKRQFTKEEQRLFTPRTRDSVILDAADEAIYKASRRVSRNLTPMLSSPTSDTSSIRDSMDSIRSDLTAEGPDGISTTFMESFRWMDEEDNLDLRLVLDDYHANLDGVVIPTPTATQRPSFRRHMSISKIPFGRTSISSYKSPLSPTSLSSPGIKPHNRQMSKTLSMMQPKHTVSESVSSIDPNATHYQDPEARLKLRVYLASPQKFDEAIEFGFPSMEGVTDADKENKSSRHASKDSRTHRFSKSPLADIKNQTFLYDGTVSVSEDDISMLDSETPVTPLEEEIIVKPHVKPATATSARSRASADFSRMGPKRPTLHKQHESYASALAGSREMTLRMTLTRPDLRADESMMYGWQSRPKNSADEPSAGIFETMQAEKFVQGPFGGVDGWGPEKENGVVRRIWNRVKSQRRSS